MSSTDIEIARLIEDTIYMSKHTDFVFEATKKEKKRDEINNCVEMMWSYTTGDPFLLMHCHMAEFLKLILDTKDEKVQKALIEWSKTLICNVIWVHYWLHERQKSGIGKVL